MFRTLGLRHLCVINTNNKLLGIVTRIDLVSANYYEENNPLQSLKRREIRKRKSLLNFKSWVNNFVGPKDV